MAITNFGTLKTALAGWLNRDDLTTVLPDFIRLGQVRLSRELPDLHARTEVSLSVSPLTLAASYGTIRSLALVGRGPLQIVTPQRFEWERNHFGDVAGVPQYALVVPDQAGGASVYTVPSPDGTYSLAVEYRPALVAFSADADTDTVLTNWPDLYLYAALAESAPYLKDDERIPVWEERLTRALEATRVEMQRRRFPNTPIVRPRRAIGG